ncbi:peroxiredoxin [Pontiellaceae bacterium B12219]|nr:peroxiredoxin [Pontiellaceae bacterium B12219]
MKIWIIGLMGCLIWAQAVSALEAGDRAPLFTAVDQDGKAWVLEEHLGAKPIVVYFYPAAMTGGCTKQACSYRDYLEAGNPDFAVVGISGDAVQNLKWFQTSEKLNFPLLSDPGGEIAGQFGVSFKPGEQTITRTVDGVEVNLIRSATTARWTFVIQPDGTVGFKSDSVKPAEDLKTVLSFLSAGE